MSNPNQSRKLSLKVMINKHKSKVLFAEASNYVADALLGFLTLPLGNIVEILKLHETTHEATVVIGSLKTLYSNLVTSWIDDDDERIIVDPTSNVDDIGTNTMCSNSKISEVGICCLCGEPQCGRSLTTTDATFLISDDLRVVPMETGFLQTLNHLGISDIDGAELRSFSFGIDEVVNLLKLSLISSTPLTDLVFNNVGINNISPNVDPIIILAGEIITIDTILKASLQKSTNKFLFAEATMEFVEFLLMLLTLPLGDVVRRLDKKFPFKNIRNLYKSVAEFIGDDYFKNSNVKKGLTHPKLSCSYLVKNDGGKKQKMFIVSDDLEVEPFSISSMVLILNGFKIPLSDVKETEFSVGPNEALRILEASLVSKTVLTDALVNPMLSRVPNRKEASLVSKTVLTDALINPVFSPSQSHCWKL